MSHSNDTIQLHKKLSVKFQNILNQFENSFSSQFASQANSQNKIKMRYNMQSSYVNVKLPVYSAHVQE